jgi:hypothetical protein
MKHRRARPSGQLSSWRNGETTGWKPIHFQTDASILTACDFCGLDGIVRYRNYTDR